MPQFLIDMICIAAAALTVYLAAWLSAHSYLRRAPPSDP